MFGEFVRELRKRKRIGLREFCQALELDPSNWSKVERKLLAPPKDPDMLRRIADILGLQPDTDDWYKLHDSALLERGRIPNDVLDDVELVRKLPLFFRTVRGQKLTEEELLKLAERIRRS